jgi:hypothetical protein
VKAVELHAQLAAQRMRVPVHVVGWCLWFGPCVPYSGGLGSSQRMGTRCAATACACQCCGTEQTASLLRVRWATFVVCTALSQVVDTCELLESACGWQWPQSVIRQPGVLGDSVLGACLGCGDCNLTAAGTQHTCFQQRTAVLLSTRPSWVPLGSFLTHTQVW